LNGRLKHRHPHFSWASNLCALLLRWPSNAFRPPAA
jgi:hypothetical protein